MFTFQEILETIKMVQEENLDIRTITMGISLRDCADPNPAKARQKYTIRLPGLPEIWSGREKTLNGVRPAHRQ